MNRDLKYLYGVVSELRDKLDKQARAKIMVWGKCSLCGGEVVKNTTSEYCSFGFFDKEKLLCSKCGAEAIVKMEMVDRRKTKR